MGDGWWAVLLFALMAQEAPKMPRHRQVTQHECEDCGMVYHGDSWSGYPPRHCPNCGGSIAENTFMVESVEAEAWEHARELRDILFGESAV